MGSRCDNSNDGNSGSGNHYPFHRNYHLFFVNRDFIPRSKYYKDFSHCDLPKTSCRCSSNSYQGAPRPPERYPESERDNDFRKPAGCCKGHGGRINGNSPYPRLPPWIAPGECSSTRQTYSFNPTTFTLRGYESFNPFSPSYGTPDPYFGKSNSNFDPSNNPSPVHNDRPDKEGPDPDNRHRHKQGNGPGGPAAAGVTGGKKITSNFDAWATPIDTPNASTSSISINKINSRDNLNSNKKNQKQPNAKGRNLTSASPGNPERLVTAFDAWATPSQISITSSRSSTLNSKTNLNSSQNQRKPIPGPDPKIQTLTSPGNSSQTRDRGGTDATTTTPRKEDVSQGTTMTIAPVITTRAVDYKNADYSSPTKSAYTSTPPPQRETSTQASPENAAIFSGPDKGNTNLSPDALGLRHTEGAKTESPFNEGKQRAEPSADGVVDPFSKTVPPQSNVPLPPTVAPKKAILKNRAIPGQEPDTSRESTTSQTQTTNGINASSSSSIVDSVTKKVRISDRKTVDRESNTVSTPLLSTATATATTSKSPGKPKTEPLNNQIQSDGNTSRSSADGKEKAFNTSDGNPQGKSGSDNGVGKGGESSFDHIETIIPPEAETESKKVPDPANPAKGSPHSRGTSSSAKSNYDAFGTRISDLPSITQLHQKWVEETKKDKATTTAPTPQASTTVSNSDQEKENSYTVNVVELPGLSKAEFFQNASRNQGSWSGGEGKQKENYSNGGGIAMDDSGGLSSAVSINNETSTPSNESTQLNTPVPVPGESKYQYGQSEYAVTSPANFLLSDLIPEPIGEELQSFKLNQTSPKAKEIKLIPTPTASEAPTRANKLKQQLDEINASLGPRLNSGGNGIAHTDAETHQRQQQQQHYNKSDQIPPNEATVKTRAEVKPRFLPGTKNSPLSSQISEISGTKENFEHQSVDQKEFPKSSSRLVTTPLQETPVKATATTATEGEEPWEWLVGGVSSPKKTPRTPIKLGGSELSKSTAGPAKNGILPPEILENALTLMKNGPPNQTQNRLANPDSKEVSETRIGTSDDVVETHPANNPAPLKNSGQHVTAKIPNRNSSTINNLSNHEQIQSGQNSPTPKNSKFKSNKTETNPRMSNGSGRLIGNEASFNPHKGPKTEAESLLSGSSNSERAGHDNTGAVRVPVNALSIEESEVGTTTPPEELAIHRFDKWGTPLSDASINLALRERNPEQFVILNRPVSQVVSPTNLNTAEHVSGIDPLNESRQEYQSWHGNDSSIITRSPVGNSEIAPNQQEPMKVSSRPYSPQPGKLAVPANANPSTAPVAQRLESQQLVDVDVPTRSPVQYSRNGSNKQLINRASINSALRERNPDQFGMLNAPASQMSPVNLNAAQNVNGTIDPLSESRQEYQPRGENDSSIITSSPAVGNSKLAPNQQELVKVSSRPYSPQPGKSAVPANSSTAAFAYGLESPQLVDVDAPTTRSPVGYSRNGSNNQLINKDSSKSIKPVENVNPSGVSKLNGKGFASSNDTEIEAKSKIPGRYFDLSKVSKLKQQLTPSRQVSVSAKPPEAEAETDTKATTGVITARTKNALSNNSRPKSEDTEFSLKIQSPVKNSKTDPNQELPGFTANSSNPSETAAAVNPIRLPNSSGSNKLSLGDRHNASRSPVGSAKNVTDPHPQLVQLAQESSRAIAIQTSDTETGPVNLNSPKFSNAAVQVYSNKMAPPLELKEFKTKSPFQNSNKALIQPQDVTVNDKVNSPQTERKPNTGKVTPKMFTTPTPTTPPQAESTSTQTTVAMSPKPLPINRLSRETEVDLSNMSIQNENGHDFIIRKSEPTSTDFFPPNEVEMHGAPRIPKKHGRQVVAKIKTISAIKSSGQPKPQPLEELEKNNVNKIKNANQRQTQDDYPNQDQPLPGELSPVIESLFFNPLIGQNRSDGNGKNTDNTGSQRSSGRQSPTMHITDHKRSDSNSNTESNAATRRHFVKAPPKKKDLNTADAKYEIDEREQFIPDFNKSPEKSIKRYQDPRSQFLLQSQPEATPNEVQKQSLDEAIQTRDNRNKKTNTVKDKDSAITETEALNSSTTRKISVVPTTKTKGPKSGDCSDDDGSWLSRDAVSGMTRTLLNPWYWAAVVGGLVVAGLLYQNCGCGCQSHSSHSTSSVLRLENVHNPNPSAAYKGACQGQSHANSLVRVPLNHTNTNPCKK